MRSVPLVRLNNLEVMNKMQNHSHESNAEELKKQQNKFSWLGVLIATPTALFQIVGAVWLHGRGGWTEAEVTYVSIAINVTTLLLFIPIYFKLAKIEEKLGNTDN